jgi:hypothetical protein
LLLCNAIQRIHAYSRLSFTPFLSCHKQPHHHSITPKAIFHPDSVPLSSFIQSFKQESVFPPNPRPFQPFLFNTPSEKGRRMGYRGYGKGVEEVPAVRPSSSGEESIHLVPPGVARINWSC